MMKMETEISDLKICASMMASSVFISWIEYLCELVKSSVAER